jgi:cystathionine beta-lyase family protein involved in aluminum resistance
MANRHGKDSKFLLGKYDISAYLNEVTPSMSIETAETSTFSGNAKTYITGQNDGTISLKGLFDGDATAISAVFEDIINNDLTPAVTLAYDGGLIEGRRCTLAIGKQTAYEVGAPVSDVVSLSGELQVTNGLRQGILLVSAAQSASTLGTAFDNAALTSLGATANLHVTANTRNTASTIKVQHSVDNSTWVDLITFTSVGSTIITSESIAVSGTINRYLRANTTLTAGTGSITLTISIARRN